MSKVNLENQRIAVKVSAAVMYASCVLFFLVAFMAVLSIWGSAVELSNQAYWTRFFGSLALGFVVTHISVMRLMNFEFVAADVGVEADDTVDEE